MWTDAWWCHILLPHISILFFTVTHNRTPLFCGPVLLKTDRILSLTQVRCTKPSSWCFTPWILSKVMHLSHEHEGSSAPRMAMLEIYSSFIIKNCKIFPESCERLFTRGCSDQTRENGFKLKQGRFRLDIWKKSFTMLLLRHWNIVPGEAVDSPPPESVQGWTGWGSE